MQVLVRSYNATEGTIHLPRVRSIPDAYMSARIRRQKGYCCDRLSEFLRGFFGRLRAAGPLVRNARQIDAHFGQDRLARYSISCAIQDDPYTERARLWTCYVY